ncbi:MAG: UDP-N-acetylmuramoyl-L-alanyl-D-glutamate--2,6-diaminopimelate ligase [Bacteroidales bacterium]|nr:UDP-N-acetylmuramoyl-L-alanyl-D-glutamate--2,6-diaminopimelate ligase [Bacteroidales bacterium]
MKTLKELFKDLPVKIPEENLTVHHITSDSRNVQPGDIFFAIPGSNVDGHQFISQAIEKGAQVIVCKHLPEERSQAIFVQVDDPAFYYGEVCARYFDHPSKSMKVVGVTGTNGKTSTVTFLYQLMQNMGYRSGLISTIHYFDGIKYLPASHTTPDAYVLQALLHEMVKNDCRFVFMEVSSHAAHQKRIQGIYFAGGVFTNITHDHLDYHGTFANYLRAKQSFFDNLPPDAFALYNSDDRNGLIITQNTKAKKFSYGINSFADFKAEILEKSMEGSLLSIQGKQVWVQVPGKYNAYNILATYGVGTLLGLDENDILISLSQIQAPKGRFEVQKSADGVYAIVDYAHTPDALEKLLTTIKELNISGELWVVGGAGGNRDKTKRPIMGEIMASYADKVILTSDNPRFENPERIIQDMFEGVSSDNRKKIFQMIDRRQAIEFACRMAKPNDVILIVGKGHEPYQEIQGIKYPFNDYEIIAENLSKRT